MDIMSILATLLALGGFGWGAWNFIKNKFPSAADLAEDVISRIQGDNSSDVAEEEIVTRKQALAHMEALVRYFEQLENYDGVNALVSIAEEIITIKE